MLSSITPIKTAMPAWPSVRSPLPSTQPSPTLQLMPQRLSPASPSPLPPAPLPQPSPDAPGVAGAAPGTDGTKAASGTSAAGTANGKPAFARLLKQSDGGPALDADAAADARSARNGATRSPEQPVCEATPLSAHAPQPGGEEVADGADDAAALLAAMAAWQGLPRPDITPPTGPGGNGLRSSASEQGAKGRQADAVLQAQDDGSRSGPSSLAVGAGWAAAQAAERLGAEGQTGSADVKGDRTDVPPIDTVSAPAGSASILPGASSAAGPAAPAAEARIGASPGTPGFAHELGLQVSVFVREGIHHAVLELHPVEMGPLTVQIELDGQTAQVRLSAEQAPTRQALEQALPTLAGTLQEAGITLGGGGVFEQPRQAPEGRPGDAGHGRSDGSRRVDLPAGPDRNGPLADTAGVGRGIAPGRRGLVDLIA